MLDPMTYAPHLDATRRRGHALRLAGQCLLLLALLNALFLGARFADNLVSKPRVAAALRAGYADGSIPTASYPAAALAGRDMYSDCIAAQLAVLGGTDAAHTAIAPRLLTVEQVRADGWAPRRYPCRDLQTWLDGRWPERPSATYTRFWQGGASMLALALTVMPVEAYRALLLNLTLALIALSAVLAARGGILWLRLAPLLVGSFAIGGQMGYGQLFSYGPPQIALWLTVMGMIAWRTRLTPDRLVMLAVVSGSVEAFLDQLISVPLVAGVFLVVAGVVAVRPDEGPARAGLRLAVLGGAWMAGFLGSYAAKLGLSVALLGPGPFVDFAQQLLFRVGTLDPEIGYDAARGASRFTMLWGNVGVLAANFWRLGYAGADSIVASCLLLAAGIGGWAAALLRRASVVSGEKRAALAAGMPYLAASAFLLLWVMALPEHTARHAFFTVRAALLWLVSGWGWYCCIRAESHGTST